MTTPSPMGGDKSEVTLLPEFGVGAADAPADAWPGSASRHQFEDAVVMDRWDEVQASLSVSPRKYIASGCHDALVSVVDMASPDDVVWPSSPRGLGTKRLATRLDDLAGKRVAFLWDHLFRGDEVFPALAGHLYERFPEIEIVDHVEFGNTHGGDEKEMIAGLPDELSRRHIDAVVSAMGC